MIKVPNYLTTDFDFELPAQLIAQQPSTNKEETPMLVFDDKILDKKIADLVDFFEAGDVMVFNQAKVIKAKLSGRIKSISNLTQEADFSKNENHRENHQRQSPNSLEGEATSFNSKLFEKLHLNEGKHALINLNLNQKLSHADELWSALCKPAKKIQAGDIIEFAEDFSAEVIEKLQDGWIKIKFNVAGDEFLIKLDKYGLVPLPPYIKRNEQNNFDDIKNYQTIYAKSGCAVAAPTAGLHFNEKIFAKLADKKILTTFLNLDVGAGTFLPVKAESIKDHKMHSENFSISQESCEVINRAKKNGKKVIAIGTTSLRTLESAANQNGFVVPQNGCTEIFIYPPYKFKIVDALLTNFHLPKSTLFMLVCAFIGRDNGFKIYQHAIAQKYHFYSFGDSSLLFRQK